MSGAGDIRGFKVWVAVALDMPKAVILEQIAFRTSTGFGSSTIEHGVETRWLHKTFKELHEEVFPWWGFRTIERHFKELQALGLIESTKLGSQPFDRTLAWRVVHDHEFWSDKPLHDTAKMAGSDDADMAGSDTANLAGSSSINTKKQKETTPPSNEVEGIVFNSMQFDREEEIALAQKKPDHGPTVARFWQRMMAHHKKAAGFQAKVGQGEQGMLKTLFKALGAEGPKILDHALGHWDLFLKFTRENYDIKLTVKPQIKGLAQCRDPLAEFAQLKADAPDDEDPYANLKTSVADFEE